MATTDVKVKDQDGLKINADKRGMQFKTIFESESFQKILATTLPRHLDPIRLIRVVLSAMQSQPKLFECTPESVVLSVLRAGAVGIEPDGGVLGQGYLVPFWSNKNRCLECQFIPGYRGLVKLARNSGEVADVWAEVVYEKDQFNYELGVNPKLEHKRNDQVTDAGAIKYAYAVARFRDGERKFVVMNKREIDTIKARSSSKDKNGNLVGPWIDWEAEMAKKTAVRRLSKLLPLSVETQTTITTDAGHGSLPAAVDFGTVAAMLPHSAQVTVPEEMQPEETEPLPNVPIYNFANYVSAVETCTALGEPTKVYDAWFGPERPVGVEWTGEENMEAPKVANTKEESLKPARGTRAKQELVT